jgi:transcriptional regulator with XRE-family HTH domain
MVLNSQANNTNRVFVMSPGNGYARSMRNRIREFREAKDWSQQKLADIVGTSQTQIDRLEKNQRRVSDYWLEKLGKAFNCNPLDIISDDSHKKVPVMGYVGAGFEVFVLDENMVGDGLEEVDCPIGYDPHNIVALRVRGDSMIPMLEDGWLVFYSKAFNGIPDDAVGKYCVVKMANDGLAIKKLKKGSKLGYFHLISHNTEPQFDVVLEWAAKIIDIRPA